ncbi:hypothetical protein PIROE2DRAFT_21088 [Piromyces sp. E2]|nr:hypothetical protein PIROE2DRAFT_21088 [Piromyces sp. E2]|eukprot:OUM60397.1 hypothetical protein PIROE2DRAFT_21088 [Piromyces sp. E2]
MKCLNLFVIFTTVFVKVCYPLTCEEAKNILKINWDGNCCELQQFICDDDKENILSIDILSLKDIENEVENNNNNALFARSNSKENSKSTQKSTQKSKSKSKSKPKKVQKKIKKKVKKVHRVFNNDTCYVNKQTMSDCLLTCDSIANENEKITCQNNCQENLKDSEDCREACEIIDQTTGKCLKFKDDDDDDDIEEETIYIEENDGTPNTTIINNGTNTNSSLTSEAYQLRMNTFFWIVAITLLIKLFN